MGFSPILVDKMLQKHGDHDSNTVLESLLSHHNSGSESSSSLGSLFDSDNEENSSKQDISRSQILSQKGGHIYSAQ